MSEHSAGAKRVRRVARMQALWDDLVANGQARGRRPPPLWRWMWAAGLPVPPMQLIPWWVLWPWMTIVYAVMLSGVMAACLLLTMFQLGHASLYMTLLASLANGVLVGPIIATMLVYGNEKMRRNAALPCWYAYTLDGDAT